MLELKVGIFGELMVGDRGTSAPSIAEMQEKTI